MTEIEGNKIIAEFMGGEIFTDVEGGFERVKNIEPNKKTSRYVSSLEYHTSWEFLMPVVEKINTICSEKGRELSNRSRDQDKLENQCDNPLHWKSWSYHYVHLSTSINDVWQRVIEFITWYNSQSK